MAGQLGADQLDAVAVQHAGFGQADGQVEGGLPADGGQQGLGPLALDDPLQHAGRERLDVGAVGQLRVGHDGGRVGVDQHHPVALGAQHLHGLGAGVVELGGLAHHDGTGARDQDGVRCRCVWAWAQSAPVWACIRSGLAKALPRLLRSR